MSEVNVELWAFAEGKKRKVLLPPGQEPSLSAIYHYGQNEVQPQDCPSVSAGDVICLANGERHLVLGLGYRRLTEEEYQDWIKLPQAERALAALRSEGCNDVYLSILQKEFR